MPAVEALGLDLRDAGLAGFSMGGEVARCLGRCGDSRVSKAMLLGAVPPSTKVSADLIQFSKQRTQGNAEGTPDEQSSASLCVLCVQVALAESRA